MILALEWIAFGGSLLSVWLYGRNPRLGPLCGMSVALAFIAYGIAASIWAAAISNLVFLYLHYQNWTKGRHMDWKKIKADITRGWQAVQNPSHQLSADAGWWDGVDTDDQLYWMTPVKLCLIHSEISEAMEGHRKGLPDDKLPHYPMFAVELADAVIRIGDLAGRHGIDLGPIIAEKMEFNHSRPDHKRENRAKTDGKKY